MYVNQSMYVPALFRIQTRGNAKEERSSQGEGVLILKQKVEEFALFILPTSKLITEDLSIKNIQRLNSR